MPAGDLRVEVAKGDLELAGPQRGKAEVRAVHRQQPRRAGLLRPPLAAREQPSRPRQLVGVEKRRRGHGLGERHVRRLGERCRGARERLGGPSTGVGELAAGDGDARSHGGEQAQGVAVGEPTRRRAFDQASVLFGAVEVTPPQARERRFTGKPGTRRDRHRAALAKAGERLVDLAHSRERARDQRDEHAFARCVEAGGERRASKLDPVRHASRPHERGGELGRQRGPAGVASRDGSNRGLQQFCGERRRRRRQVARLRREPRDCIVVDPGSGKVVGDDGRGGAARLQEARCLPVERRTERQREGEFDALAQQIVAERKRHSIRAEQPVVHRAREQARRLRRRATAERSDVRDGERLTEDRGGAQELDDGFGQRTQAANDGIGKRLRRPLRERLYHAARRLDERALSLEPADDLEDEHGIAATAVEGSAKSGSGRAADDGGRELQHRRLREWWHHQPRTAGPLEGLRERRHVRRPRRRTHRRHEGASGGSRLESEHLQYEGASFVRPLKVVDGKEQAGPPLLGKLHQRLGDPPAPSDRGGRRSGVARRSFAADQIRRRRTQHRGDEAERAVAFQLTSPCSEQDDPLSVTDAGVEDRALADARLALDDEEIGQASSSLLDHPPYGGELVVPSDYPLPCLHRRPSADRVLYVTLTMSRRGTRRILDASETRCYLAHRPIRTPRAHGASSVGW